MNTVDEKKDIESTRGYIYATPLTDIIENKNAFEIIFDLPGIEKDDIKIDALGNLKGYIPLTQPAEAEFTLVNKQDKVFDFITGKQIPTVDGKGSVSIIPGGGRIIFVGTENEFKKISLR